MSLFQVKPSATNDVTRITDPEEMIVSPSGKFCYVEKLLPKGSTLSTVGGGGRQGSVMWNGPVVIDA